MPRTYVAKRLLEHGPLTRGEFIAITGWPEEQAWSTLRSLVRSRVATFTSGRGHRGREYLLRSEA